MLWLGAGAGAVQKLDEAAQKGVYQIRDNAGNVLVIENGKYAFKTVANLSDLKASLWCVKVTEEASGKEPIYDFFNKSTGETLAVSDLDASAIKAGTFASTDSLTVGESLVVGPSLVLMLLLYCLINRCTLIMSLIMSFY